MTYSATHTATHTATSTATTAASSTATRRSTPAPRASGPGAPAALFALVLVVVSALPVDAGERNERNERIERRAWLMGTTLQVSVEAESRSAALAASEAVLSAVADAERRLSTWTDDSELARLTSAGPGEPMSISSALADDLDAARRCHRLTHGAFDPAVGPLVSAWGLRDGRQHGGALPSDADLQAALEAVAFDRLEWSRAGGGPTARRLDASLHIDEGAFGKGAGLDDALAALAADPQVMRAELDFGGQLAVYRPEEEPQPYRVLIADPDDRSRVVAGFDVLRGAVATTGNGERGIVVDGERLGHVLDPRTGRPAADFGSLTVWVDETVWADNDLSTASATFADCLSTGLYVLGPDAALDWAERHAGVEVVVVERGGDGIQVRASTGLADRIDTPAATRN